MKIVKWISSVFGQAEKTHAWRSPPGTLELLSEVLAAESLPFSELVTPDVAWIGIRNTDTLKLWFRLRAVLKDQGWQSIIAGDTSELDSWLSLGYDEMATPMPEPSEQLYAEFLNRRRESTEEFEEPGAPEEIEVNLDGFEIPPRPVEGTVQSLFNLANSTLWPEVAIVFVRVDQGWKIPHVLSWGGWNEAPYPEDLGLTLWSWEKRFGAVPVAFTSDTIELYLDAPLDDKEQIATVASEMLFIAPDVVWQGTETTTALAAEIANRKVWFMWWD